MMVSSVVFRALEIPERVRREPGLRPVSIREIAAWVHPIASAKAVCVTPFLVRAWRITVGLATSRDCLLILICMRIPVALRLVRLSLGFFKLFGNHLQHRVMVIPINTPATHHEIRAATIRARRVSLDLSVVEACHRAGLSAPTWDRMEDPGSTREPQDRSLRSVSRALRWPPDALHRLKEGADPESFPTVGAPDVTDGERARTDVSGGWAEAAEMMMMIADLPGPAREAVLAMTREFWAGRTGD